ncbi:hypothetical protein LSTR_LSTR012191, partial [Laodelphax striatellus]
MYVIFPAEDIVELTLRTPIAYIQHCNHASNPHEGGAPSAGESQSPTASSSEPSSPSGKSPKKSPTQQQSPPPPKKKNWLAAAMAASRPSSMVQAGSSSGAGGLQEGVLRDLSHPSLNEQLKNHNAVTFKLVRTVSDFTQELSQMYEQHAGELQLLVANFRKKNAELRKEKPNCPSSLFHTWETLLQEVEADSQAHGDIASVFGRQVSRPLLERSFHRKVQARKVFAHRENFEVVITKAEDKLAKCRQDYKAAYLAHHNSPNSTATLAAYLDAHNSYVSQLHATNGMVDQYSHDTLPQLLQELEDVYTDLCSTLSDSVLQGAEVISARATDQAKRYEGLSSQCRTVQAPADLNQFVRCLSPLPSHPHPSHRLRLFTPPQPPPPGDGMDDASANHVAHNDMNYPPPLKNELVIDRLASINVRQKYDSLRAEANELETQIKQLQDALDSMQRIQQRSLESQVFNKVNELQRNISMKRFDLKTAQIHLSAVKAQKELFGSKLESADGGGGGRDRKMSSASTGSMKNKWLKAFKSLKTTSSPPPSNGTTGKESADKKNQMYHAVSAIIAMRKNGRDGASLNMSGDSSAHQFQEYTYKKITPCDVCSQVLRGHTRQGLKCRICKLNVHLDCQEKVGRCQTKSRLLRRQKSTSEIETRITPTQEEEGVATLDAQSPQTGEQPAQPDNVYQVLKTASYFSTMSSQRDRDTRSVTIRTMPESYPPRSIMVSDRDSRSMLPADRDTRSILVTSDRESRSMVPNDRESRSMVPNDRESRS